MRSHLIPVEDDSGIWTDNYERFLVKRAELLTVEIMRRCGISDNIAEEYRNPVIDAIETEFRDVIHQNLSSMHGLKYWDKCINRKLVKKVDGRIEQYVRNTPGASKQEFNYPRKRLDFCDVSDYSKIILGDNWNEFSNIFRSEIEFERYLHDLNEYRNAVKHNRNIDTLLEYRAKAAVIWFARVLDIDLSEYDVIT
jgi:hypothetical protein